MDRHELHGMDSPLFNVGKASQGVTAGLPFISTHLDFTLHTPSRSSHLFYIY